MIKERNAHASRLTLDAATLILKRNTVLVLHNSAYTEDRHVRFYVATINVEVLASGFEMNFFFTVVLEGCAVCAFG